MTTNQTYRYTITINGEGGELAFIPLNSAQLEFWMSEGDEALARHLSVGNDEGIPPEMCLGTYYDHQGCSSGIELDRAPVLTIEEAGGRSILQATLSEKNAGDVLEVKRTTISPEEGVFFRTFEKGALTYFIETNTTFDVSKLKLLATSTPEGKLLSGMMYDGQESFSETDFGKEWALREAWFIA